MKLPLTYNIVTCYSKHITKALTSNIVTGYYIECYEVTFNIQHSYRVLHRVTYNMETGFTTVL